MFYYYLAYRQLKHKNKPLVVAVPSGNFGNICGNDRPTNGSSIDHFVAATNVNDAVPAYLESGFYQALKTTPTISNAMDVGDPSNFVRIQKYMGMKNLNQHLSGYRFTDEETRTAMQHIHTSSGYVAILTVLWVIRLKKYLENHPDKYGIFLETAIR